MPLEVTVIPNPAPSAEMLKTQEYRDALKRGAIRTFMANAKEICRAHKGRYIIQPKKADVVVEHKTEIGLDQMDNEALKVMAVNLGVRFGQKKQIKREELLRLVRNKLDEVSVVDDGTPVGLTGKSNVEPGDKKDEGKKDA